MLTLVLKTVDDRFYILKGRLLDLNTNEPLQGKEILLNSYPPLQITKQKTNKEGNFETVLNVFTSDSLYKFKGHFRQDSFYQAAESNTVLLKVEISPNSEKPPVADSYNRKTIDRTNVEMRNSSGLLD